MFLLNFISIIYKINKKGSKKYYFSILFKLKIKIIFNFFSLHQIPHHHLSPSLLVFLLD